MSHSELENPKDVVKHVDFKRPRIGFYGSFETLPYLVGVMVQ